MANAIYHMNRRSSRLRDSGFADSFKFGAASDAAAAAVAAGLSTYLASQLTSLTKQVGGHDPLETQPESTLYTVDAFLRDTNGAFYKFHLRNGIAALLDAAIVALLSGSAYAGADCTLVALSAPPSLPNSGLAVASVVSRITKRT